MPLETVFRWLRQLYALFWQLVLSVLLGGGAYLAWYAYQDERQLRQLGADGRLVTVRVDAADPAPRALRDHLPLRDVVYLQFAHATRRYETRFVADTSRPQAGDQVRLLYSPALGRFGQPPPRATTKVRGESRLINWTGSLPLTAETKALALFVTLAVALFFMGGGLLTPLLGHTLLHAVSRGILFVGLAGLALFSAYEALEYYHYVARLQRNGRPLTVAVLTTRAVAHGKRTPRHTYEATFRFRNQERVVAIERVDFKRLSPQDSRLTLLYDVELNDFIVTNFSHISSDSVLGRLLFNLAVIVGGLLWLRTRRGRPAAAA